MKQFLSAVVHLLLLAPRVNRLAAFVLLAVAFGTSTTDAYAATSNRPIRLRDGGYSKAWVRDVNGKRLRVGSVNTVQGMSFNCMRVAAALDSALAGRPRVVTTSEHGSMDEWKAMGIDADRFVERTHVEIASELAASGHGARGIVWGGAPGGHAWNVYNDHGRIRFLDGQSGFERTYRDFYKTVGFLRTD